MPTGTKKEAGGVVLLVTFLIRSPYTVTIASLLPRIRAGPGPEAHRGAHVVHLY